MTLAHMSDLRKLCAVIAADDPGADFVGLHVTMVALVAARAGYWQNVQTAT
jgi:hypothetical protein